MPRPKSTDKELTRRAIAAAAEDLFRSVGYQKTTLADIASRVSMSPANIYRFFSSKQDINGAICDGIIVEFEAGWPESIDPDAPAAENLAAFLVSCHRHVRARFLSNQGIYDMIEAAIEQNWPVMLTHINRMVEFAAGILEQGVQRGEFQPCHTARVAPLFLLAAHTFLDPRRHPAHLAGLRRPGRCGTHGAGPARGRHAPYARAFALAFAPVLGVAPWLKRNRFKGPWPCSNSETLRRA